MKIKHGLIVFFKLSFVLRVGAVIFELEKVSMSNFVKFELRSMTLKIGGVFEEQTKFRVKNWPKGPGI